MRIFKLVISIKDDPIKLSVECEGREQIKVIFKSIMKGGIMDSNQNIYKPDDILSVCCKELVPKQYLITTSIDEEEDLP